MGQAFQNRDVCMGFSLSFKNRSLVTFDPNLFKLGKVGNLVTLTCSFMLWTILIFFAIHLDFHVFGARPLLVSKVAFVVHNVH